MDTELKTLQLLGKHNIQNPILRLGKMGNTYNKILAKSSVDNLRTFHRAQKTHRKDVENEITEISGVVNDRLKILSDHYKSIDKSKFEEFAEVSKQCSKDGTRKYLLQLAGGHEVEAVYIPEEGRGTLCVSSQVGCTLTCSFCHTGTQKLVRNLTPGEIVGQVLIARERIIFRRRQRNHIKRWKNHGRNRITCQHNLVFLIISYHNQN